MSADDPTPSSPDDDRFDRLFGLHYPKVVALFLRWGYDLDESRDLAQETFLRVYRYLHTFRNESADRTWIIRIARSMHLNRLRQTATQKRCATVMPITETLSPDIHPDPAASPLDVAITREQSDALQIALEQLPPRMRRALGLRALGLANKEIANVMGLTPNSAKVLVHQARLRLREKLGPLLPDDSAP